MADAYPKKILPLLEGKIGELRMMRFWSKVDMRGPDECWDWRASLNSNGYGRFKLASYTMISANRVALIGVKREEPDGLHALHHCDNRKCCNPAHLYFGTHAQNMQDKSDRNRWRGGDHAGEKNPHAKLTDEHVATIVRRLEAGWGNKEIAADLPVSDSMVSLIRLGKMWRPVTERLGWTPKAIEIHKPRTLSPLSCVEGRDHV